MASLRRLAGALFLLAFSHVAALAAQATSCLPITGSYTGVAYTQLINAAVASVISNNSGALAPSTDCSGAPVEGQYWLDTSAPIRVMRVFSGGKWVPLYAVDQSAALLPQIGGGIATLTAASVTDLCAVPQSSIAIQGATTINSFGSSCAIGQVKLVTFSSVLTLAASPANLLLPTGANIATQAGDSAVLNYVGGGIWRAYGYSRADGTPLNNAPSHYAGQSITMRATSCPAGSLPEDGRTLAKSDYPALAAVIGTAWGGDASTFVLPSTGGNVDRGWIAGQGVDAGRTFGALQDWNVGEHDHGVNIGVASNFSAGFSAGFTASGATDVYPLSRFNNQSITAGNNGNVNAGFGNTQTAVNVSGTVNGTVNGTAYGTVSGRTAGTGSGENRVRNITAYHCIFTSTF